MTELELYKFIHDNNCEYHWYNWDVDLFVDIYNIKEFNNLFHDDFFEDCGLNCIMKKKYFCFEMRYICEYYDIKLEKIFKANKDK